jgi:hypothetical protein
MDADYRMVIDAKPMASQEFIAGASPNTVYTPKASCQGIA